MLPLKSVQPFVIRVDNTTGVTDVVPVYVGKGDVSEAVTRYLLHNYVVTRERYFYAMAEQDYNLWAPITVPCSTPPGCKAGTAPIPTAPW